MLSPRIPAKVLHKIRHIASVLHPNAPRAHSGGKHRISLLGVERNVSVPAGVRGAALSLPCVVDRSGTERVLEVALAPDEQHLLRQSAEIIRENSRA